jgi:hypothetical protein
LLKLPKLWCAATLITSLGACPKDVDRFRFTCLSCRLRRQYYGRFKEPAYYVKYTFKSILLWYLLDSYVVGRYKYTSRSGRPLILKRRHFLRVDPRGHFLAWRMAAIKVLDCMMMWIRPRTRPLVEFAEFLANYP